MSYGLPEYNNHKTSVAYYCKHGCLLQVSCVLLLKQWAWVGYTLGFDQLH